MVICAIKEIFSFSFVDLHSGDLEPAVSHRELRSVHGAGAPAECPAQPQVQDRSPGRTDHLGMVRGRGGSVVQVESGGGDPGGLNGGMDEGRVQLQAGRLSVSGTEPQLVRAALGGSAHQGDNPNNPGYGQCLRDSDQSRDNFCSRFNGILKSQP